MGKIKLSCQLHPYMTTLISFLMMVVVFIYINIYNNNILLTVIALLFIPVVWANKSLMINYFIEKSPLKQKNKPK